MGWAGPWREWRNKAIAPYHLWLACERAKSLRRSAMRRASFVGRRDLAQQRLIERPRQKFHCDRNLIGLRSIQAAAVRIARVRYAVINHPSESRRHHDRRKAAHGAQVHRPAAAGAAERVEIGLQARLAGNEIRIRHLRSRLEDARFEPGVVYVSDAAWKHERRRNRRVDIDE